MTTPTITCDICPRACKLQEGQTGFCHVRKNVGGKNVDALYELFPLCGGLGSFCASCDSVFFPGCNLNCSFCIFPFLSTQFHGDMAGLRRITPRDFANWGFTQSAKCGSREWLDPRMGRPMLIFVGGEPTLHYEYILEVSRICREHGGGVDLKVLTSGFVSSPIMEKVAKAVDSISIGVKASASARVYRQFGADPAYVLKSIKIAWDNCPDIHVKDLIGPGCEPSDDEVDAFASWLRENTDADVRYYVSPVCAPVQWLNMPSPLHYFPGDERVLVNRRLTRVASRVWSKFHFTNMIINCEVLRSYPDLNPYPRELLIYPHGKASCARIHQVPAFNDAPLWLRKQMLDDYLRGKIDHQVNVERLKKYDVRKEGAEILG